MSVGAASIKRAASKAASEETMKKTEVKAESGSDGVEVVKVKAESGIEKTVEAKANSKEASAVKTTQEAGPKAAKKTASRKKTAPKKVTSAAIPSVSPEVVEKMKLNRNQVCHLTEELPVHLL